jgi:hypothetical protein
MREIVFIKRLWRDEDNRRLILQMIEKRTAYIPNSFVTKKINEGKIQQLMIKDERNTT